MTLNQYKGKGWGGLGDYSKVKQMFESMTPEQIERFKQNFERWTTEKKITIDYEGFWNEMRDLLENWMGHEPVPWGIQAIYDKYKNGQ